MTVAAAQKTSIIQNLHKQVNHCPLPEKNASKTADAKKTADASGKESKAADATPTNTTALNSIRAGKLTLKMGARGEPVRQAQDLLNRATGSKLAADGKFGDKTEQAVTGFQRAKNLKTIDGKLGAETVSALDKAVAAKETAKSGKTPNAAEDARKTVVAKEANLQGKANTPAKTEVAEKPVKGLSKEAETAIRTAVEKAVKEIVTNMTSKAATPDAKGTVKGAPEGKAAEKPPHGCTDHQPGTDAKKGAGPKDANGAETKATDATKKDAAPHIGSTLRRGSKGPEVSALQGRLKGLGYDIKVDGNFGPSTDGAVRKFQKTLDMKVDGVVGPQTYGKLGMDAPKGTAPNGAPVGKGNLSGAFRANETAIAKANRTGPGRQLNSKVGKYADTYKAASQKTGVPASIIAAIHGQESGFGTHRQSINGPESGFGLDPRHVTNSFGNAQLAKHGLGKWQRGRNNATNRLQSAVIAAEHFKRNAKAAGVTVGPKMTERDILVASTSYIAGPNSRITRRAKASGKSFVFNPKDSTPHPYHPGGTSIGNRGQKIRVAPGYKKGLLRWDVMIPMIERKLG